MSANQHLSVDVIDDSKLEVEEQLQGKESEEKQENWNEEVQSNGKPDQDSEKAEETGSERDEWTEYGKAEGQEQFSEKGETHANGRVTERNNGNKLGSCSSPSKEDVIRSITVCAADIL